MSPSLLSSLALVNLFRQSFGLWTMMEGLWSLWWCLLDTCSGLCDKLRYVAPKPLPGYVSEDMLMEIFSRMPAECLHQCKLVYEDWNTLFSTPYFNHNMFLPRASPTIIVHRRTLDEHKLFYIDDDHRGGLKCKPISLENPCNWVPINELTPIRFSWYGLLFLDVPFAEDIIVCIVNPITWKSVGICYPKKNYVKGDICGAFFHPAAREFRMLWVSSWITSNKISQVEFKLLMPSSEKHPQIRLCTLSKLQSRPVTDEPPVNLHDCLHWMCYKYISARHFQLVIMVFSIITEEFKLMPIPNVQPSQNKFKHMHLFDLDGYLSLWELTDVLSIWTVEDYYASWSWAKRYTIEVKLLHKRVKIDEVSVVGSQNGALVIHWMGKGIFVHHLQHKTTKKFLFSKLKGSQAYSFTTPFLHAKCLISMTGFIVDEYKGRPGYQKRI